MIYLNIINQICLDMLLNELDGSIGAKHVCYSSLNNYPIHNTNLFKLNTKLFNYVSTYHVNKM